MQLPTPVRFIGLSQTMLLVRLLKIDPLYFKPTDHPFAAYSPPSSMLYVW